MSVTAIPELDKEITNFQDMTHQLNNYNEIHSLNTYLNNQSTDELARMNTTNEALKSRILKLRQYYMTLDYKKNLNKMKADIMLISVIGFAFMFIVAGLHMKGTIPRNFMFIGLGVVTLLYVIVILSIVQTNAQRRKSNWTQFYWQSIEPSTN